MVIKDRFKLVGNSQNILKIPKNTLLTHQLEENSPRHVFTFLTLKQRSIKHFGKDNPDFERYQKIKNRQAEETVAQVDSGSQNKHGIKVISLGVIGTGLLIITIGIFAAAGKFLVLSAGAAIMLVGVIIRLKNSKV